MQKLAEITLQNTVQVKVDCLVNEEVVAKNFKIIIDCLNELKSTQDNHTQNFTKNSERFESINKQLEKLKQIGNSNSQDKQITNNENKQSVSSDKLQKLDGRLDELEKRTSKNENSILENIKDLNLLNKQISDLKELINKIGTDNAFQKKEQISEKKNGNNEGASIDDINAIKKQVQKNTEQIHKLNGELEMLKKLTKDLQKTVKELEEKSDSLPVYNMSENSKDGNDGQSGVDKSYLNDLQNKLAALQKKVSVLNSRVDDNSNSIEELSKNDENLSNEQKDLRNELQRLKDMIQSLGFNSDDWNKLLKELEKLKKELENLKKQNIGSKTSLQDDSARRFDKASYTQTRFGKDDDKLKDLQSRVQYLQKMLGSKRSIEDDSKSNQEKLPLIKRPQRRDRDTSHHDKTSLKKDMNEIKNQLQNWLSNYLAANKTRDNLEDLELKIQELRNLLGRKADQEGMRKGLTFLEAKINQLYLFLTEPDGEDAMIVRKGFNCLSCSKKVQKLRGKIGPHINWNNMTATNYSPPKVGYSKHMGENTPQRQDDL